MSAWTARYQSTLTRTVPVYTALAGCEECDWSVPEAGMARNVRKRARYHTQTRGHRTVVVGVRRSTVTYSKDEDVPPAT